MNVAFLQRHWTNIAAAAGVTCSAIYWHLKNKIDLFNKVWRSTGPKIDDLETEYQAKYPDIPLRVILQTLICILTSMAEDGHRAEDAHRRALMEIIFYKCEFVGEMTSLLDLHKVLNLSCLTMSTWRIIAFITASACTLAVRR